jgi:hypothetical protein
LRLFSNFTTLAMFTEISSLEILEFTMAKSTSLILEWRLNTLKKTEDTSNNKMAVHSKELYTTLL